MEKLEPEAVVRTPALGMQFDVSAQCDQNGFQVARGVNFR